MIITFFEAEVCTWWNSKFYTFLCEWWRVIIIIYLIESWVTWKNRFTQNSTHFEENTSHGEVDVEHKKRLYLFWNIIKKLHKRFHSLKLHTTQVELSRPLANIRSHEPSLWFYAWSVLDFHSFEYSSEFCIEILGWGNRVSSMSKPPIPISSFQYLLSDQLSSIWLTEVNFTCCLSFIAEQHLHTELTEVFIWILCFEVVPAVLWS